MTVVTIHLAPSSAAANPAVRPASTSSVYSVPGSDFLLTTNYINTTVGYAF